VVSGESRVRGNIQAASSSRAADGTTTYLDAVVTQQ